MKQGERVIRIILWIVGIYHVALATIAMLMKDQLETLARMAFRFTLTVTPEVRWLINPFAAYVLAFGVFAIVVATNPVRYRPLLYVIVGLFGLRVIQRLAFVIYGTADMKAVVSPVQNVVHLCVVAAIGVSLAVLASRLRVGEQS